MKVGGASSLRSGRRLAGRPPQSTVPTESPLFGRFRERERIDRLVTGVRARRSGALVLHGEFGAGKSRLLDHALAQARGMRVLRCDGDPAESELWFSGLNQLLRPVLELVPDLAPRLAVGLEAAMGSGAEVAGTDRFLVRAGALALLTRAARDRPLLCLVDDAQWLDPASSAALAFVARRLDAEGIALLVASGEGEGRRFGPAGVPSMWLGGLDEPAAGALLAHLGGASLVPEVSARLVELTDGLPLALVDAMTSLNLAQLAGRMPLPEPLPLSSGLRRALMERLHGLPAPVLRLLVVVAAAGVEPLHVIVSAGEALGIEAPVLESAEASGLLLIDGGLVRFRSRLVEPAVYHEATFFERRAAHLALAGALGRDDDSDRRAWHLAASAMARDEAVAREVERTAESARRRGDPSLAATALERAAELTPDERERGRRLAAAATAGWLAGRPVLAGHLVRRASRLRACPLVDADIAALGGTIGLSEYHLSDAQDSLLAGVQRVASSHPVRALELLVQAGEVAMAASDTTAAGALARKAEALAAGDDGLAEGAPATGDDRRAVALLRGVERVLGGHYREAAEYAEQAISMAGLGNQPRGHLLGLATALSAGGGLSATAHTSALRLFSAEVARLRATGAIGGLPNALAGLAWLEFWTDRHRCSLANASEGLGRARSLGQRWAEGSCAMSLAMLAAVRGNGGDRAMFLDLLLHPPGVQPTAEHAGAATWALALDDLGAGRYGEALTQLEELAPGPRPVHPWYVLWSRPDAVEAAVRAGRMDAARVALEVLERGATEGWPAPARALLARSRALLATGREADDHYRSALALHERDERVFQEARTRLLWGEHLRRGRRRVDARDPLRLALETFERLDARPWAERAQAELRATGETVHRGAPGGDELTPQELRIAQQVARGASNREVAEQLFLSPRTVGYHLARIYQKLGVSSRTRLAHLLAEDELRGGPPDQSEP
ncbi:MAG TPA: AAA family ATPase [Candidatus Dormibacteraeota bacterium]